jgi:hypothetical protein
MDFQAILMPLVSQREPYLLCTEQTHGTIKQIFPMPTSSTSCGICTKIIKQIHDGKLVSLRKLHHRHYIPDFHWLQCLATCADNCQATSTRVQSLTTHFTQRSNVAYKFSKTRLFTQQRSAKYHARRTITITTHNLYVRHYSGFQAGVDNVLDTVAV